MGPVPVSAFEMYSKSKKQKKKPMKKKSKDVKVNHMLEAELGKAARAQVKKGATDEKNTVDELEHFTLVQAQSILGGEHKKNVELEAGTTTPKAVVAKKLKKKSNAGEKKMREEDACNVNGKQNLSQEKKAHKETEAQNTPHSLFPDSVQNSKDLLAWVINPISVDDFFSQYWEKLPMHISRQSDRDYYSSLLSSPAIDAMLRKNNILFGKNLDVTSYSDGKRKTHNPTGRAQAAVVWDYYRNGCSVRLLNPQTYHHKLRALNTCLQELFGSFVGANAYLTPPNSQGFAPHYDDIEAFVLQIEGCKMWKLYAPRSSEEVLPRSSSQNFQQDEIGKPILEVKLEPGDLLYFPRGFIHQASTVEDHHSLHITISTYQHNSWADFMEKLVPAALANAIDEDEEFRRGMPLDILQHVGVVHSESESSQRQNIIRKLKHLFSKLFDHAPIDAGADQLGKDFQHDALPPMLSSEEKKCSVVESCERINSNGEIIQGVTLTPKTQIRLTRSNVLRLVSEEEPDIMKVYHSMDNSLEYHGEDLQCIEIPTSLAPAVEHLIHAYPSFTAISALPADTTVEKMQIAVELWERGLVLSRAPLSQGSSSSPHSFKRLNV